MGTEQIKTRLRALRTLMKANQINAYLVLSSDPHLSEYLPVHWQSRAWLSGFEGSAGTLLITEDKAALWTDSRYWSQAQDDLKGTGIQLMKQGDPTVIEPDAFLRAHLPSGSVLCLDYEVMPLALFQHWHNQAKESGWVIQKEDILLDILWVDRPSLPKAAVYDHSAQFAVRSRKEKLATIRQQMKKQKVQWHLISSLDDIAWLLNLRGADVNYNPVFLAHLLIGLEQAWLFIDLDKVPKAIKQALADDTVQVLEYEHLCRYLKELPEKNRLWFDPNAITAGTVENTKHLNWVQKANPSTQLKACKNKAEQDHIRQTMLQDGIALCEFYAWLEQTLLQRPVSELEVEQRLTEARAKRAHFVSPSFATIAGFNANGAMPHYQATKESYSWIEGNGLLLIDSGGQYLGGTTDITRVTPVGEVCALQKKDYTLVLKAMIALSRAVFPKGVSGQHLDAIARLPLWQHLLDYGHGTGHGVGYFLNVHEGPQNISWRLRPGREMVPLSLGMVTSNEPALYREGRWGVRIENLILVQPAPASEFGEFYQFETLTLCPIDTRCIDKNILNEAEVRWLNEYHEKVRGLLAPHLEKDALQWLLARTKAI